MLEKRESNPLNGGCRSVALYVCIACALLACAVPKVTAQFRCNNPNSKAGYCVSLYECPSLLEIIQSIQLTASQRRFLQNSQCNNGYGRSPFVCCTPDKDYASGQTSPAPPPPTPTSAATMMTPRAVTSNGMGNLLPEPPRCGPNTLADKIYNGNDTALDQYPWMALLAYTDKSGRRTLSCGGSLINQRYVLTAAHCVRGAIESEIGPLAVVRLGEYDISSDIDCIGSDCNNKVLEVGYEEVTPHPQFNPSNENRHHDIALIRLNADVTYTDFIRPVCLPLLASRMAIDVGEELIVSGWGRTLLARQSNTKKQLGVPINDHAACARKFATKNIALIDSQLCAGGDFAQDSCDGDSGGPLMRRGAQQRWFLEGVVSFGNRCGLEGWPGVYTRVTDYIDWVQQNMKP